MDMKHTANTRISDKLNEKLEEIIQEGGIHSRSEAVRFSIHITHLLMTQGKNVDHEQMRDIINEFINL
jgi:Arc/MetJ-type ribon-helix-helix transcriptional regulator